MSTRPETLLCVCNYPANTGYAWDFIESLYARVAQAIAPRGYRTLVAYPRIDAPPRTLDGFPAEPVLLDATLTTWASIVATARLVREQRVKVIYFTDGSTTAAAYGLLRLAGVGAVIVHSHWSGPMMAPRGPRRLAKWIVARLPLLTADTVVTVSDYVAAHHRVAGLFPAERTIRVWNGMAVGTTPTGPTIHEALNLDAARPVIACACRASRQKGVPTLLRTFDRLLASWPAARPRPVLVYMGDGPDMEDIRRSLAAMAFKDDVVLAGYRADAPQLLATAAVCALPSIGVDALPLAVMHPMALGRPVVATAVGGVPEMVIDDETGLLVPASDEVALATALRRVLEDPALAARLGAAARARIASHFSPEQQIATLSRIVLDGFGAGTTHVGRV